MLDITPLHNKVVTIEDNMYMIKGGFLRDGKLILIVATCDNTVDSGTLMEMPLHDTGIRLSE